MKLANNEDKIAILIIVSALLVVGVLSLAFKDPAINSEIMAEDFTIRQKWNLPEELNEVSGIDWIDENKIACVQDEQGIIFIYNLSTNLVEKTIKFAKTGDFEGIALVNSTAYVLQSDGKIFEVGNYLNEAFEVEIHETPFSEENDMESMTYDKTNHRLLLIPKEKDLESKEYIGLYGFNLDSKKIDGKPIIQIKHTDPIFNKSKNKKKSSNSIHPADVAIHPTTGNYYIVDGKNQQLLVCNPNGEAVELHQLNKKTFKQPEGILFSPKGDLFISNEGKKGNANILQLQLDQ